MYDEADAALEEYLDQISNLRGEDLTDEEIEALIEEDIEARAAEEAQAEVGGPDSLDTDWRF